MAEEKQETTQATPDQPAAEEGIKLTKLSSVKTSEEAERSFKIKTTFDFTGVPIEDVYQYALSYLVINRAQNKFRTLSESELEKLETYGFMVKVAEGGRAPADPLMATKRSFNKLPTKEAKLQAIRELEAELAKE